MTEDGEGDTEVSFNELLISEVMKYQHLWKTNDRYYRDRQRATNSWEEMSIKFEVSADDLKKTWYSLRTTFRQAYSKYESLVASESGAAAKFRKWRHYENMLFIKDHVGGNGNQSRFDSSRPKIELEPIHANDSEETNILLVMDMVESDEENSVPPKADIVNKSKPKRRYFAPVTNSGDETDKEYKGELIKQLKLINTETETAEDVFGRGISLELAKFPPSIQRKVRRSIYDVIDTAHEEMENLNQSSSWSTLSQSQSMMQQFTAGFAVGSSGQSQG